MLPWQPEFQYNQPKKTYATFPSTWWCFDNNDGQLT